MADIDAYISRYSARGWSLVTRHSESSFLRAFFRHAESPLLTALVLALDSSQPGFKLSHVTLLTLQFLCELANLGIRSQVLVLQLVLLGVQFADGLQHQIRKLAVVHAPVARLVGRDHIRKDFLDLLGDQAELSAGREAELRILFRSPIVGNGLQLDDLFKYRGKRFDVPLQPDVRQTRAKLDRTGSSRRDGEATTDIDIAVQKRRKRNAPIAVRPTGSAYADSASAS